MHSLARGQRALAALFGTRTGDEVDKFARCDWEEETSGVPILTECPHWLVGTILDRVVWGNHIGFLLEPVRSHGQRQGSPLMVSDVRDLRAGHPAWGPGGRPLVLACAEREERGWRRSGADLPPMGCARYRQYGLAVAYSRRYRV